MEQIIHTATLADDMGNPIDGAPKIVVNNDKSYSFGDPANITFQTDTLQMVLQNLWWGKMRQQMLF